MDLTIGNRYNVHVVKIIKSGIIVSVSDTDDTFMIHLSKISKRYVTDPAQFVLVGCNYEAEAVSGVVKPVELSLLHLDLQPLIVGVDLSHNSDYTSTVSVKVNKRPLKPKDPFEAMIDKMNKDHDDKIHSTRNREKRRGRR